MAFRSMLRMSLLAASLSIASAPGIALAAPVAVVQSQSQAPDNSAANKDQSNTAQKQGNSAEDRQLASRIRKVLVNDKSLSTYAKNVKVIVKNGIVTLKGPVRSDEEKKQVESYAAQAVGSAGSVTNELTVQGS